MLTIYQSKVNMYIIRIPEEERRGQKILKNNDENFPNMGKKTDIQIHKAWRIPNKVNPKDGP